MAAHRLFIDSLSGFWLGKGRVVEVFEQVEIRSDLLVEEKRRSALSLKVDKEGRLSAVLKRLRHLENLKLDQGLFEYWRDLCLWLLGLFVRRRVLTLEPQVDLLFAPEFNFEG